MHGAVGAARHGMARHAERAARAAARNAAGCRRRRSWRVRGRSSWLTWHVRCTRSRCGRRRRRISVRPPAPLSLAPSLARPCQCTSRRTLCVPLRMSPCMLCAGKIRENKIKVFAHTHARTRARTRAHLRARRCWWTRAGGAGRRSSRRSHGCATRPRAREARRSLRHTARADRSHSEVSLFRSFAHSDVSRIRTDVSAGAHAAGAAAGLPRAEHPLCGGDQGRRREIHGKPKAATEGSPQLAICGLQHGGCVAHGSRSAGRRPMGAAAHVGAFVQAARH